MPITIKHAPSAAAIGESAYTIGRGEKRRWATDVALKEQALSIQGASVRATSRARAGQLALGYEQLESREEQQQDELEFRKQQYEDEPARQLEKGLQQQKVLREQEVWEYTESQKRRRAQVIEGLNWLQQRDDWTPEQKEDAARQLWGVFHKVIPGPVDAGPGIQQRFKSGWVTDETTGERWREQPDGKFEKEGMTREQFDKSYDSSFKTLASIEDIAPTTDEVLAHMDMKAEGHARFQQRATQTQEEKKRLQQKAVQDLKAIEEQAAIKKQATMERDVASLPRLFSEFIEKPKIGRKITRRKGLSLGAKVFGKGLLLGDKVFGEEAYNGIFLEVSKTKPDIPPEVIKAELDKWWLAKYKEEEGEPYQKFQDPSKFKGAAQETGYGQRADGTQKGSGFFGELKLPDGGVATEYSVGVQLESKGSKETEIPSLVPTLTKDELALMVNDIIPNRKKVPDAILQKAVDHANKRVKQGKSPFAGPGEAAPDTPEELRKGGTKQDYNRGVELGFWK